MRAVFVSLRLIFGAIWEEALSSARHIKKPACKILNVKQFPILEINNKPKFSTYKTVL